ncbi:MULTISPECIES: Sec-independent protein translocase subunit TatA [unclassified Saccharopolyspora]|uniref:Sec-independent protein translocase subunit TatA n=1 Tax=unclassified Saccharopolyspora TaxID=2646250 RepID=UPI0027E02C40|nr:MULTISPECIES: Sec-independent protein translocase subunit TatA [unclassified Saccharopolyspora]
MSLPGGWELVLLVGVVVLLFGAGKLPDLARSVGQSARVFKAEARGMKEDEAAARAAQGRLNPGEQAPGTSGTEARGGRREEAGS